LNILITGGAGFIGAALTEILSSKGYNITILDNMSKQIHGEKYLTSSLYARVSKIAKIIHGSVTNYDDLKLALKSVDVVVHLAAETGTGQSMYEIEKYVNVNVQGTATLLNILANEKHTVCKIIVASSRAIYGEGRYIGSDGFVFPIGRDEYQLSNGDFECKCPVTNDHVTLTSTDENSIIHPTSIYGITKQSQEELVLVAGEALGIASFALRYQNVYGPGQSLSNPYTGILSIFSTLLLNGKDINIFEDGKESRDFIYIDDAVDATVKCIESDLKGSHALNVGSGKAIDVLNVAKLLKKSYGSTGKLNITGNYRVGDIRHNYADISKIQKLLGFQPKVSFEVGLAHFTEWVKGEELDSSMFDGSIEEMKEKGMFK